METNGDSFIGIDIDIKSDSKPAARKRPRPKPTAGSTVKTQPDKRPKRPPPTPAPPPPLIKLLQSDSSVLKYFKSLQQNVDYDVEKWKAECARWKKLALEGQGEKTGQPAKSKRPISGVSDKTKAKDNGNGRTGVQETAKQADVWDEDLFSKKSKIDRDAYILKETKGANLKDDSSDIPITDELLFGDDDDESHDSGACEAFNCTGSTADTPELAVEAKSQPRLSTERAAIALQKLKEAKKQLDMLGVSLVEVEVRTISQSANIPPGDNVNESPHVSADNSQNVHITIERILHRVPDDKVVADIFASLKRLIKTCSFIAETSNPLSIPFECDDNNASCVDDESADRMAEDKVFLSKLVERYHPFCGFGMMHMPTIYNVNSSDSDDQQTHCSAGMNEENVTISPPHPAATGLEYVINILNTMEIYCTDSLDDNEWDALFQTTSNFQSASVNETSEQDLLKVGMRNRSRITSRILSSLDVEITRMWGLVDRDSYLLEPSLFFHVADVSDNVDLNNKHYCSKIYNRLVNMEERIAHARIATLLHRRNGDWQKATELVVGYIVSCAPSVEVEDYPKLPPVLSMCVLEALLLEKNCCLVKNVEFSKEGGESNGIGGWFSQYIHFSFASCVQTCCENQSFASLLLQAIAYPIQVAALVWNERSYCTDDRIRDVALIELAAFHRIQQSVDGLWVEKVRIESLDIDIVKRKGNKILDLALQKNDKDYVLGLICAISLLTTGEVNRVLSLSKECILTLQKHSKDGCDQTAASLSVFPMYCSIYMNLISRKWETMKLSSGTGRHTAAAFTMIDQFSPILESAIHLTKPTGWMSLDPILQCCVLMGNCPNLLRIAAEILPTISESILTNTKYQSSESIHRRSLMSRVIATLIDAGNIPTVRVINLKRRPDRRLDFMSGASKEQLIVCQAPITLKHQPNNKNHVFTGGYAFDGKSSYNELRKMVFDRLSRSVSDLVADKWIPGDLRAFDNDARNDSKLVSTTLSEKACALSHIASWIGVEKSLSELSAIGATEGDAAFYQKKVLRMLEISGFARGEALMLQNEGSDPTPCCVILEDDAVLCDRFTERLDSLLEELPRDFHFCSIGYSRPQRAPIVEYSSQLGLPSCLWYLTGYILSLEGAKHLIESLPVVGPVDSWIGMKMCSNWDNTYGQRIGVGNHAKVQSKKLPSRKEMSRILRFRAFAALVPLCEQKNTSSELSRGGWRDKDTDIAYSGCSK